MGLLEKPSGFKLNRLQIVKRFENRQHSEFVQIGNPEIPVVCEFFFFQTAWDGVQGPKVKAGSKTAQDPFGAAPS